MENFGEVAVRKLKTRIEGRETLGDERGDEFEWIAGSSYENADADIRYGTLIEHLNYLRSNYTIVSNQVILPHRRVIGRAIAFGKRAMRRCLRWYIEPIVNQQSEFNSHNVIVLNKLTDAVKSLANENYSLKSIVTELRDEVSLLREEINKLS